MCMESYEGVCVWGCFFQGWSGAVSSFLSLSISMLRFIHVVVCTNSSCLFIVGVVFPFMNLLKQSVSRSVVSDSS